jgi:LPPG:FO 2-phospho-L-lactate transferase
MGSPRGDLECQAELAEHGPEATMFGLGDRDVATHPVRFQMRQAGHTLSQVTQACRRWQPGATRISIRSR